jgi:hypothetical protein
MTKKIRLPTDDELAGDRMARETYPLNNFVVVALVVALIVMTFAILRACELITP